MDPSKQPYPPPYGEANAGFAPPQPNYAGGYPTAPPNFGGAGAYPGGQAPFGGQPGYGQPAYGQAPYGQAPYGQGFPPPGPGFGPQGGFPMPTTGFHMPPPGVPKPPDVEYGGGYGGAGGSGYGGGGSGADYDGTFDFTDKTIRRAFIRKVYSILMVQLGVTMGFIALFLYHEPTRMWTRQNAYVFYMALGLTIVLLLVMACCEGVRRKAPGNFICLALFTVAEGFVLGAASSTYKADAVLLAAGITTVVCLALTAFSFQTKWDFTAMGGILFVAVVILFVFGILSAFLSSRFPIIKIVYASIGALIFSVYLVYDTQLMMGGKHKYSISPEEYIFAALNLYLDIVNIFIYILTIIGASND